MQVGCCGLEDEQGGRSTKVALVVLYGFLDAEEHGGEPLVQPGNGVKLLHLSAKLRSNTMKKKIVRSVTIVLLNIVQ